MGSTDDVGVDSASDVVVVSAVVVASLPVARIDERLIRGVVVGSASDVVVGSVIAVGADDSPTLVVVGSAVDSAVSEVDVGFTKAELRTSPSEGKIPSAVVVGAELSVVEVASELSTPVDAGADDFSALVVVGSADSEVDVALTKEELRTSPREGRIPSAVVVGAELSIVVVSAELSTPLDPADLLKETPSLELSTSGVGVADGVVVSSVKIPPGPNVIPSADVVVAGSFDSGLDESLDGLGVG